MEVWLYLSDSRVYALTVASDGANLPAELGAWTFVRSAQLEGDGFDVTMARQLIEEHGFVCFE